MYTPNRDESGGGKSCSGKPIFDCRRMTTSTQLAQKLPLTETEKAEIDECLGRFRMAVTDYYASLIDPDDPNDPIRAQCIPDRRELEDCGDDMDDPLDESKDSPAPYLVHRYPDRVLLLVTFKCFTYCRHCTRRRLVGEEDRAIGMDALAPAMEYIRSHREIRDVLISGGDPLTLPDGRLEERLAAVRAIAHVEVRRIGTRAPVTFPMRIDEKLVGMLKRYQPLWINTHFNHPREITPESERACALIVDAGIPLGNQSVLLKGVNDDVQTLRELMTGLVRIRVRPYYLYQCDLSRGIGHFRTDVRRGIELMHGLTGYISGFAVPKYVIDSPHGGGKIPVNYEYLRSIDENEVVMENYRGDICRYPQPK